MSDEPKKRGHINIRQNIIAGILTVVPLYAVWIVLDFLTGLLAGWGRPAVVGLAGAMRPDYPDVADFLLEPAFTTFAAVVIVLFALYCIGAVTTLVLGARLLAMFDRIVNRIPFVKMIYGSTQKLIQALRQKPENVQRVVLIDFPNAEMRAIGLVMKTFKDTDTGRELAAVYVPTTPNPTSGYLEIVPVDKLTATSLTMDEAMAMVISGGAVSPDNIRFGSRA